MEEEDADRITHASVTAVTEALANPAVVVNRQRKIIGANEPWKQLLATHGVDPAFTGVGMDYFEALSNGLGEMVSAPAAAGSDLEAVLSGKLKYSTFACHLLREGKTHHLVVQAGKLAASQGALLSHHAVSAPKRNYQNRSLFSNILEESIDGIFLCSPSGKILLANSSMARWLGRSVSEIVGRKVSEIVPADIGRILTEQNAEITASGRARTFEMNAATAHGARTFLITKGLHHTPQGRVKGVFGIVRDISGVRAMEREIIDTSDKEKQRLGQELHENLCQYLVGISLLGNVLHEELLRLGLKQAEDARQITTLVKEAITEVRTLVKGLSTLPLEQDEGLSVALQELAEQARNIGRVKCRLRVPRSLHFITTAAAVHLFRIAQEAVHNAIKHAQATTIRITLANNRRSVVLTVQDDGIGFASSNTIGDDTSSGLGLHIMNYRSRAIGARLDIRQLEGRGTAVVCTMPKV